VKEFLYFLNLNTIVGIVVTFFLISITLSCESDYPEDYILIYNGYIADKDGVEKVAQMAMEKGFEVVYISRLKKLPDLLVNAKAFIIGGTSGDTGDLLEDLADVQDDLKTYINNGGSYLGICGGAYVASKGSQWSDGYETGMALVDIESFAFDKNYSDAQIITISWKSTDRTVYYLNGPAFSKNDMSANCNALAYYTNVSQDVAVFKTEFGKGNIILCGPHPEADESWLIDSPEPLNADKWTNGWDMFSVIFDQLFF